MCRNIIILATVLCFGFYSGQSQETGVRGTVHDWPSDTVYFCTLPFHSPHSYQLQSQKIEKNGEFHFDMELKQKGVVAFLSPYKDKVDNQIEILLFNNLNDEHYWGHCRKIYTYGSATLFLERGCTLDVDLTYNSWPEEVSPRMFESLKNAEGVTVLGENLLLQIGLTEIRFNHPEKEMFEVYQTSFDWDNQCDVALSRPSSKNLSMAITNVNNSKQKLLNELASHREEMSPLFYNYLLAEIEFGARKEFFKYLKFNKKEYFEQMISSGEIPQEIADIVALDHSLLTNEALFSEEFVEYVEFYLNFVKSLSEKKFSVYHPFDMAKLILAVEELPANYAYYYVANQFLQMENPDEYREFCNRFLEQYPDGELNKQLKEKFQSDQYPY